MGLLPVALALVLGSGPVPAAASPAAPAALVLRDGRTLSLREAPRWAFGRAFVTLVDGRRIELLLADVDLEASRSAATAAASSPRIWTLEDLAALRRGRGPSYLGTAEAASGGAAGPGETEAPRALARAPARSEADWRQAASELHASVSGLEAELRSLERRQESWEAYARGGGPQGASAHELGRIRRARKAAAARLTESRGRLLRLEDEARRSNTPPGWLR